MSTSDQTICNCEGPNARHGGDCAVLREFKLMRTPEGLELLRKEYGAKIQAAVGEMGSGTAPRDLAYRLTKLGVPGQVVLVTRDATETPALSAAKKYVSAHRARLGDTVPFLTLVGDVGVGKTVAAVYALQDFCRRWEWNNGATGETTEPAMFVRASSLNGVTTFDEAGRLHIRNIHRTRFLVLDDCGDESEAAKTIIRDTLKERLDSNRQTAVTSNLAGSAFRTRYGEDIADRLRSKSIAPNLSGAKSMRQTLPPRRDSGA